jgi:hypothetical protein
LQSQLQTEEDALNTSKQQRVYLETPVNQYRSLQGTEDRRWRADDRVAGDRRRIDKLRAQLTDLSSHYTAVTRMFGSSSSKSPKLKRRGMAYR